MKSVLLFLLGIISTSIVFAQAPQCGTMDYLEQRIQRNPDLQQGIDRAEFRAQQWIQNHPESATGGTITIPVVVHVVYKDAQQNISDAQVLSQIDILNQDFRRLNADTANTRSEFDSLATDMEIEFCLATTDPQGNPTTGINRVSSSGGQLFGFFGPLDDVKAASSGGVDPWPTDQYLNIWVCDLVPIILGYAQFPGEDSLTDGVVIGYTVFGNTGTVTAPYNKGRTTVHEVGHWLGLRHIWGDGDCTQDDFVDDTPLANAASQGGCQTTNNTCVDSLYDYPDMVENYMDYSEDGCMNMFTHGQKTRVWSFLNTDRASLFTSQGCSLAASAEAESFSPLLSVYPNPTTGIIHLQWNSNTGRETQMKILDVMGKTVWSGSKVEQVDLSGEKAGIYFMHLTNGENSWTEKLVLR